MRSARSARSAPRHPFVPLVFALAALAACRDVNAPEPTRTPGAALAAKSGIPDTLPFHIEQSFHARPDAERVVCAPGISLPEELDGAGVVTPHMGRTTTQLLTVWCAITEDTLRVALYARDVGATGDELFGVVTGNVVDIHDGRGILRLSIFAWAHSGWFRDSHGWATAVGVIDLVTGAGSYRGAGTIAPGPEGPE